MKVVKNKVLQVDNGEDIDENRNRGYRYSLKFPFLLRPNQPSLPEESPCARMIFYTSIPPPIPKIYSREEDREA
jgi:hypothetical protein